jgi:indole-3-glycerol phosphate synthase / phosphoribosylanthranilate isomerase
MIVQLKSELPGVLGKILRSKLSTLPEYGDDPTPSERDFLASLSKPHLGLIAEIKRRSPSKGAIREGADPVEIAKIYARHAQAISVLTDEPFFGGSLGVLEQVRAAVDVPLLMKDFIVSEAQVRAGRRAGADAVLLMSSLLPPDSIEELLEVARALKMEALVEVHDRAELDEVLGTSARIIGVNNRDLATLAIDLDNFARLAPHFPSDRLTVCESGIETRADVDRVRELADAVLIGTTFMSAPDIEAKIVELSW